MAKAIKRIQKIEITEEDQRKRDMKEIEDALVENKEAILETLHMIGHMNERGVLPMLRGLFGQGDKVLDILVKKADTEETANTLKNLLLLFGTLGMLDVKQLEPLILKVNAGLQTRWNKRTAKRKQVILMSSAHSKTRKSTKQLHCYSPFKRNGTRYRGAGTHDSAGAPKTSSGTPREKRNE